MPLISLSSFNLRYRILPDGTYGAPAVTRFPLPPLRPPTDGLIALLDGPTTARLHTPIPLRLTIRNRHPTRSANVTVQLDADMADAFVVAGLRHGRIPILLPGAEESVTWNLIPVECGLVKVPGVKVLDRRSAVQIAPGQQQPQVPGQGAQGETAQVEGEEVRIVDTRWEGRKERVDGEPGFGIGQIAKTNGVYVLVLP